MNICIFPHIFNLIWTWLPWQPQTGLDRSGPMLFYSSIHHCGWSEPVYAQTSLLLLLCAWRVCLLAAYKDLQSREDTRNGAWQQEGWDEVVYYTGREEFAHLLGPRLTYCMFTHINKGTLDCENTPNSEHVQTLLPCVFPVPLIQHMDSRIMIPTKASPLQWDGTREATSPGQMLRQPKRCIRFSNSERRCRRHPPFTSSLDVERTEDVTASPVSFRLPVPGESSPVISAVCATLRSRPSYWKR